MNMKTHVIQGQSESYRVKISVKLIGALGWDKYKENFRCYGIFRSEGELLCAATSLTNSEGEHPFGTALDFLNFVPPESIERLEEIPSARVLVATDRVFEFDSVWSKKRKQLELRLKTVVTKRLGWTSASQPQPPLYAFAFSEILLLMSQSRFREACREDFTGGQFNL